MEAITLPDILKVAILFLSIIVSAALVLVQLRKIKNLETIKYLTQIRNKIWEIGGFKPIFELKEDTVKLRAIRQQLEYLASAVNHNIISYSIMKKFCKSWFMSAAVKSNAIELYKTLKQQNEETLILKEINDLYQKLLKDKKT